MSWFLKGFKLSQVFRNIISTYKPLLKFLKANLAFISSRSARQQLRAVMYLLLQ